MRQPRLLNLETTTYCNGRCVYCRKDMIGDRHMPFEMYKGCIDAFPNAEEVWPHGIGEPLLYPHIVEAVKYAADAGMKVILYTNATLLSEDMSRALIDAGLTRMVFSVDAGDPVTYAKLRPGLDWDAVVRNTEMFCRLARTSISGVSTQARITITPVNEDLKKDITEFWRNAGVQNVRLVPVTDIPFPDFAPLLSSKQDRVDCNHQDEHFVVRVNGDVVPCCRDWWAHYRMGNVNEQELRAIWEGDVWTDLRKAMASGQDYPRLCDICKLI